MSVSAFIILLTFSISIGGHRVQQTVVDCARVWCAVKTIEEALASPAVSQIRMWRSGDYAPLTGGMTYVNPPMLNWTKG